MTISWLSPAATLALGWALIHFVWQGAAIAALAAILMRFCRQPSTRYCVGLVALTLMLAAPFVSLFLFDGAPALALPIGTLLSRAVRPDILPWLVECWLAGVALLALRFAGGFLLLERKRRRQSSAPDASVLALCRAVQQRLGITRAIRYLECGWLKVPAVIGFIRPVILLPVAALTGLNEAQLRAVIAHELAHVRRWDFLVNLFQILAETLLFYHPAIWWLNRRISAERELCCDEIAMAEAGDRAEYARALVAMAKLGAAPGFAMAATHGILSERIFHILGRTTPGFGARPRIAGVAGSLILLAASLAMAAALTVVPQNVRPASLVVSAKPRPQSLAVAGPATTASPDGDDHVIPRKPARVRAITPSQVSFIPNPILIASVDLPPAPAADTPPVIAVTENEASPHPRSVVAQELADLDVPVHQYPAPVLKLNASHGLEHGLENGLDGMEGWNRADTIKYCQDYAVQTVAQGTNIPLTVDDGVKQRLAFFYWHCTFTNANGTIYAYGDGGGNSPGYAALGQASATHPVNVSGNWTISIPSSAQADMAGLMATQTEPQSCNFTQVGNTISGICTGRNDSGAVTGVIDGRQVRWVWKFPQDDGRHEGEVDFLGLVGPDGAMSGQSINLQFGSRLGAFMATPGPAKLASQK